MKKVSVIVPVFNVESALERCVNSLINQKYKYLQIVLIDDGSTDRSGEMCDEYEKKDDRIVVFHQKEQGVSVARNKGLELADGELICFLDSDDEANENYVSRLVENMEKYDLDISQACLLRVRDGNVPEYVYEEKPVEVFDNVQMQWKIFEKNRFFSMCLCGKVFKKELFDGLKFPVGRINEDESLIYLLMYRAKRIGIMDDNLYYYHYNSQSITEKKYNIHRLDCFYMFEEKYSFFIKEGLNDLADKTANEYFSQMAIVFCHDKKQITDYKAIKKKAKEIYKKDRKEILSKAKLKKEKKIFYILSYVSIGFLKLYGKLLKRYIGRGK